MNFVILVTLLVLVGITPTAFSDHPSAFLNEQNLMPQQYVGDCLESNGFCKHDVYQKYGIMLNQYHSFWHNYTDTITKQETTIAHLQGEVHVWQSKYNHLLAQQGNSTIQDQVANLTDRMDAVETKAATNEPLIYIIQNMLRTVQTDIEDIYLKINSVR